MINSGKTNSPYVMREGLKFGGCCESRSFSIVIYLFPVILCIAFVCDCSTSLLSRVVLEDEVEVRPASLNYNFASIFPWDMQDMILHIMVDDNCRVRSHCGEDISSDEAFWDGSSEIICEIGNTSSVLESL